MQFFHEKQHECYFWICPLLRAFKSREKQGRKGISFFIESLATYYKPNISVLHTIVTKTATNKSITRNMVL